MRVPQQEDSAGAQTQPTSNSASKTRSRRRITDSSASAQLRGNRADAASAARRAKRRSECRGPRW